MLTLTKKTDYALVAMAYLAQRKGKFCSARQISKEYLMPLPVLMNILKTLNREGLVVSTRGARGGYKIAVDPREVSLVRLIDAVEGPIKFVRCVGKEEKDLCIGGCPIRGPVLKLHQKLHDFLGAATLAEICEGGRPEVVALQPVGPPAGKP